MTWQYDPPYARIFLSTKSWKIWAELCFLFDFKKVLILLKYKNLENFDRTLFLTKNLHANIELKYLVQRKFKQNFVTYSFYGASFNSTWL